MERHRDPFIDAGRLVPNIQCAIDGGAFHGEASRALLKFFPAAQVHAFEPQPDLFERIHKESAGNTRWRVHNFALADSEGEATFTIPDGQPYTGSLLTPGDSFAAGHRSYPVKVTTLAAWATREGVSPDLLKLDLQGAELPALRGAGPLLSSVRVIAVEVNFVPRYTGCTRFGELTYFLESSGFNLHRIYEVHAKSGQWQFADALFIRG